MSILNEKTISRYEVIQKELTEKIQNGIFKPNERIPSEKEIVEQYGVSRITATKDVYKRQGVASACGTSASSGANTCSSAAPLLAS